MSRTLAVVVGVSRYKPKTFPSLPGAAADARRFARQLLGWGFDPSDICELTNRRATRTNILNALRVWPLEGSDRDVRIIFYFAGHGELVEDPAGGISVLLGHDTDPKDKSGTGVLLPEIIAALSRTQAGEAYLFIDACRQRIGKIYKPLPVPDPDVVANITPRVRCFACLLAAGSSPAYETSDTARGLFTDSLLRHLSSLRSKDPRITKLMAGVRRDLRRIQIVPEFCLVGPDDGWPLPIKMQARQTHRRLNEIARPDAIASISDALAGAGGLPIWFTGISGAGKTVLLQQFSKAVRGCYVAVDPEKSQTAATVLDLLVTQIVDNNPGLFPSGRRPAGNTERSLLNICQALPGIVLIIDQSERLPEPEIIRLIRSIGNLPVDLILASNRRSLLREKLWQFETPPLTDEEIKLFQAAFAPESSATADLLAKASHRSPLKLRALLTTGVTSAADIVALAPIPGVEEGRRRRCGNGWVRR